MRDSIWSRGPSGPSTDDFATQVALRPGMYVVPAPFRPVTGLLRRSAAPFLAASMRPVRRS